LKEEERLKTLLKWMPLILTFLIIAGIFAGFYFEYHNVSYALMGLVILVCGVWASVIRIKNIDKYYGYQHKRPRSMSDIERHSR
jgi:hypothetical protein